MNRHALTIAPVWSGAGRQLLVWLTILSGLTGCSRNQSIQGGDVPSAEEAWVSSACTPASPDFSAWPRRQVGGVTIAVPPGYVVEQGPMTNIYVRNEARRSHVAFTVMNRQEARQMFDDSFYRQRQKQNACRASLSGYPADVIGSYDRGQYALIALWEASWGGGDTGKWLLATVSSSRVEEAIELRAVLHTMRPAGPDSRNSSEASRRPEP